MSDSTRQLPMAADLYGELLLVEPQSKRKSLVSLIPGLLLISVAALAALWLSEHYGPPAILMGLLIGLALNFVSTNERLTPGLDFASQTLLRIGIVLLGTQITFQQFAELGLVPFVALIAIMGVVLLCGVLTAKLARQDMGYGLLAGGATAICGASAALAIWAIVGTRRVNQSEFTMVLLGITVASAIAMTFYPPIAGVLGFSDTQAGFLIGASIHDVAQAIGGGYSFSAEAGETATIVKLTRVAMLAPILFIVVLSMKSSDQTAGTARAKISLRQGVPWFVVGFVLLAGLNSAHPIPAMVADTGGEIARTLLLLAVIAAAVRSNMAGLMSHGWKCFVPVVVTTLVSFLLALLVSANL